jgi:spermidine dehydrogenase
MAGIMADRKSPRDHDLGMDRPIERRDFLGGTLVGAASLATGLGGARQAWASPADVAPQDKPGYYPPRLNGLRGSHPGSFEAAHSLRDGDFWATAGKTPAPREAYDLVVVGGGISGLSAAYFFRQQKPDARILILENHDDFGGHAKRNEYLFGQRLSLMNGGTLEIDSPYPYSKVADGLIHALGIDPPTLEKTCANNDFYPSHGMGTGIFFQREAFGSDRLVVGLGKKPVDELLKTAPLSDKVKLDVARVFAGKGASMPGLTDAQKKDKLSRISYGQYMSQVLGVDPGVLTVFQQFTHDEWGVGIDAVPALDAWGFGYPGFDDLHLKPGRAPRMGYTGGGYAEGGSYKFHFPDGNATIARLLVRDLVPGVLSGHSAADIVTAHADYTQLDKPGNQVRIRLSSVVVGVRNAGPAGRAQGADIVYTSFGQLHQVSAKQCVLACWNMMIPYLCPTLPAPQKEALHYLVKTPLVYTSVALRNWRAFEKLGVAAMYSPAGYWASMRLNPVTNIGGYHSVASPDDPILLFMVRTPCQPGLDERAQNRAGRAELLATPFETFERNIRDQLGRALGPGGFDPAQDITAITVNRWPHGYAYEFNSLFDPDWAPGQAPNEIGRARFGRIAIANSDSGAGAYTSVAIDQAYRAVNDLLSA